ncbi:MAG: hypothetical protein AB7Q00_09575 [Phycisphaerales bacterium]|nr:MAG: hypothetical protein IPK69_02030 [Phycisphaerales bacterium]
MADNWSIQDVRQASGVIPIRVAQAYGIRQTSNQTSNVQAATAPTKAQDPQAAARISRLVAGVVPGKVSFEEDSPRSSMSIYRHAGERVEAAVGVEAGRRIDVNA